MKAGLVEAVGRDVAWLLAATGTGLAVYLVYLRTHPYPGFGAGLYLQIAAEIVAHDYGLPARIPGYTADGVPFAYPPLPFYVAAVLVDVGGVDPVTLSRYLPGLVFVVTLVPYYGAAKELLGSTTEAGLAAVLFAVTPATLRWHLSAGGIVRAPAFLFTAVGLYTGLKLFAGRDRRWLFPSMVAFALTMLTHPTYAVFFGSSYLLLVLFFDRTVRGVASGAAVALGGLALTAPWWLQVVAVHGVDVFAGAAGTHSGLGGGVGRFVPTLLHPLAPDAEAPFFLVAYAGGVFYLYRRRYFLPAWLVVTGYLVGESRFLFVPGAMLTAVLVIEWALPRVRAASSGRTRRLLPRAIVLLVVVVAGALGAVYAAGQLSVWHDSASQPAFVDDHDRDAMRWVRANTAPGAEFVVLGDAAEWFPLLADRPILVGHWGVEWEGTAAYQRQLRLYVELSTCRTGSCVSGTMDQAGVAPDYVYVPKGHYTVRGVAHHAPDGLAQSMDETSGHEAGSEPGYEPVYENDGVVVLRVVPEDGGPDRGPARSSSGSSAGTADGEPSFGHRSSSMGR